MISKQPADLLAYSGEEYINICNDEFDKIIAETNLRIKHFGFLRDLDMAVFVLNNRRIIQRKLSMFPELKNAEDYDLLQYKVSDYGIRWPELDTELSLSGFLTEEAANLAKA